MLTSERSSGREVKDNENLYQDGWNSNQNRKEAPARYKPETFELPEITHPAHIKHIRDCE